MKISMRIVCATVMVVVMAGYSTVLLPTTTLLSDSSLQTLYGASNWGSFFTGVACGIGIMGSIAAAISPEPFSKLAIVAYADVLLGCVGTFL